MSGFVALWFFLTRHPCRVVTTSAKDDHLRVLWGEIGQFIQTAKYPLDHKQGGPLVVNHQDIKKIVNGRRCPKSYLMGLVAGDDSIAAMQGHHIAKTGDGIPRTLFIADESSSVRTEYYNLATTWANRVLAIGNTWPCANFFYEAIEGKPGGEVRGGDIPRHGRPGYYRKVIHVRAEDSPNVRLVIGQMLNGLRRPDPVLIRTRDHPWGVYSEEEFERLLYNWEAAVRLGATDPSLDRLVPGVKDYEEYIRNRLTWDRVKQTVSLDAQFYKGAELLMFPQEWLDISARRAEELDANPDYKHHRRARAIGIDPGEGVAETSMAAVDEYGLIELISRPTPNTAVVTSEVLAFARKHGLLDYPERVLFDRGGGGKQHADRLAEDHNFKCRTIGFGESATPEPKRSITTFSEAIQNRATQYAYVSKRTEMYDQVSMMLDPSINEQVWAIPKGYGELRRQLAPIPRLFDKEGRMKIPSKNKNTPNSKEVTLVDLIGCSPDQADATVLAVHAMLHKGSRAKAGPV